MVFSQWTSTGKQQFSLHHIRDHPMSQMHYEVLYFYGFSQLQDFRSSQDVPWHIQQYLEKQPANQVFADCYLGWVHYVQALKSEK